MTCLLWRQHRGQLLWTVVVLAISCAFMAVVAHSADGWLAHYHQWLEQMKAAGCRLPDKAAGRVHVSSATCHALLSRYPDGEQPSFADAYNFAIPVFEEGLPLMMVLIGALIGAPLVARETEQRTQLAAWTQSISRRRWYVTKIGAVAAGLCVSGLIAGFANDRLQIPLSRGGLTRSHWPWFFSIDLALAMEAVLAFALAVALGAWLRRVLPAVGAALIGFLALFLVSGWAVRSLTPLSRASGPRDTPDDSWMLGGGQYHPASQYWPLQLVYVAILLTLTIALFVGGWRATRPRSIV